MLKIDNLSVIYPDKTRAIDKMSLSIQTGENVALIGANGAGKTSLMLSLVGILEPESGTIDFDGVVLSKKTLNEVRRRIGLVFQNPDDQLFMPTIFDDVAFGPRNFGLTEEEVRARVDSTLQQLNIEYMRERSPLKLSGGEKRIAAIASVLIMQPSVLLFDEPTAFLDPRARRALINLLNSLPLTKLIATHDFYFAAETCNRVIMVKDGTIAADGTVDELLYNKRFMEECGLEAIHRHSPLEGSHC